VCYEHVTTCDLVRDVCGGVYSDHLRGHIHVMNRLEKVLLILIIIVSATAALSARMTVNKIHQWEMIHEQPTTTPDVGNRRYYIAAMEINFNDFM
jgi:hypothetical protein